MKTSKQFAGKYCRAQQVTRADCHCNAWGNGTAIFLLAREIAVSCILKRFGRGDCGRDPGVSGMVRRRAIANLSATH
jgi:hypothetical protein